jgi:hypothetical protein
LTTVLLSVPNTNGLLNAADCIVPMTNSWTIALGYTRLEINALLAASTNLSAVQQLVAGTNVTLSPSNGLGHVTISATGGGGGGVSSFGASLTNSSIWGLTLRSLPQGYPNPSYRPLEIYATSGDDYEVSLYDTNLSRVFGLNPAGAVSAKNFYGGAGGLSNILASAITSAPWLIQRNLNVAYGCVPLTIPFGFGVPTYESIGVSGTQWNPVVALGDLLLNGHGTYLQVDDGAKNMTFGVDGSGLLFKVDTNGISGNGPGLKNLVVPVIGVAGLVTNNSLVWLSTNAAPSIALPNGSICTTTAGGFYVRSNNVWVPK